MLERLSVRAEISLSISSLLTLAGLEDPKTAPSFQSVVLDQIKHLRKQLDEDEQASLSAERAGLMEDGGRESSWEGGGGDDGGPRRPRGQRPMMQTISDSAGETGLPQVIQAPGDRDEESGVPALLVIQSA
jgi:hypothetical protein